MRRRRRIGYLALVGAAIVAFFVWGGDEADRRRRAGSGIDGSDLADGADPADLLRDSRRRGDRAGTAADSEAPEAIGGRFGAPETAFTESDPEEAETDASASLGSAPVAPIALHALRGARQDPSVSLEGFDPLAPRELLAWRVTDGRFAIVAHGNSDRDGTLHFPDLVAARDGLEIVVTAADGAPGLPGASDPRRWAARDPIAPNAELLGTDASGPRVRISPREGSGEVVLADAYGVVLARYPVAPSPIDATRTFDVEFAPSEFETQLFLSHEFDDGRASEWEVLTLPATEPEEGEGD